MAKKNIKKIADELGIDWKEIVKFFEKEIGKKGMNKKTPLDDVQCMVVKNKFEKKKQGNNSNQTTPKDKITKKEEKSEEKTKDKEEQKEELTDNISKENLNTETSSSNEINVEEENIKNVNESNNYDSKSNNESEVSDSKETLEVSNNLKPSIKEDKKTQKESEGEKILTKDEIEQFKREKANFEEEKKEFDNKKKEFKAKEEELNRKYKDLYQKEERERNKSSEALKALLDKVRESRQEIEEKRKEVQDEITLAHKSFLSDISELVNKEKEFNDRDKDLKKREVDLAIKEDDLEFHKEEFEEDIQEKYRKESADDKLKIKSLETQLNSLQKDFNDLNNQLTSLYQVFGKIEPKIIREKYLYYKTQSMRLEGELNERLTKEEENALRDKYDELLKERNLTRLLELKNQANQIDNKDKEIDDLKNQLTTSRNRAVSLEKALNENIEKFQSDVESIRKGYENSISASEKTIERLLEDRNKDNEAFQFVSNCVKNVPGLFEGPKVFSNPQSLKDLVDYLHHKLASEWEDDSNREPLKFSKEIIRTFIAGLYMSPLTILQGISGTGKTSLPREIAKALFCGNNDYWRDDAPFKRIAIQSGWRDNMDLMGNYNSFESKYNETEFFKALFLANLPKYKDTLFIIILDEMNLSRPEYYFADFLSLIEEEEENRRIYLQNVPTTMVHNYIERDTNGSPFLPVPKNVRFVGTANHDETTAEFAPKTYDRSNVMDMPENPPAKIEPINRKICMSYEWLERQFKDAKKKYGKEAETFFTFLELIKKDLAKVGIGVGNRFDKQAKLFISVYLATGNNKEADLAYATDFLVKSRLFRTLKSNYDITSDELRTFKDKYLEAFDMVFNEGKDENDETKYEPSMGKELLEDVLKKNFKNESEG